ncbi:MAG: GNAT family N-acetyltransferase [Myxococcota bacterium]
MFELDAARRAEALVAVRELPLNTLFVQSVLAGHVDGEAYGDGRAWYVAHPYGMALLWGAVTDPRWLEARWATARRTEWLQVCPSSLAETVRRAAGVRAREHTRVNFRFERVAFERAPRPPVPRGVELVATTEAHFAQLEGSVVPRHFWRDGAQFVRAGGGVTALVDGELGATAFCSFRHGALFELGIETSPRHRGRGLGRLVASALLERCVREGLEPVWACRRENEASFQLAQRLGFVPTLALPYFELA